MVLKLRNNINQKLKIKISRCIDLLDDEYKSLNFTIDFYKDMERLKYERKNKPDLKEEQYEQILKGITEIAGITIGDQNKIKIFLFLLKDFDTNPNEVLALIGNVYHEIRHAWQAKNNLFEDEEEMTQIDGNLEDYLSLPSEKDAYRFQYEQMKKYANKILQIFDINKIVQDYQLKDHIMKAIYS